MAIPVLGSARHQIDKATFDELLKSKAMVVDDRRRRPLYFDGRFLAARDLNREQSYFLSRQADLGRAAGAGVVHGLAIEWDGGASITVAPGVGTTPNGELIALPEALAINLADLPEIQRLDAAFGLARIPREPARLRTGLYVLALRPVEFTANPIPSYPTSLTGPRTMEDGDIVEGLVATLIPYPDDGTGAGWDDRRSRAALDIFVRGSQAGSPAIALPLAMIALDRGVPQWVDVELVRREVGDEQRDALGLNPVPRAAREAFIRQHMNHLDEILGREGASGRFAASDLFRALPPVGQMPTAAIDPEQFTQVYFPPEVDVGLSVVPEDELPALVEESLGLPPIDLTLAGEALESTAVLVLIPLPRPEAWRLISRLETPPKVLKAAAPNLLARRRPIDALIALGRRRLPAEDGDGAAIPAEVSWRRVLSEPGRLWYVRRRNLAATAEIPAVPVVD